MLISHILFLNFKSISLIYLFGLLITKICISHSFSTIPKEHGIVDDLVSTILNKKKVISAIHCMLNFI